MTIRTILNMTNQNSLTYDNKNHLKHDKSKQFGL